MAADGQGCSQARVSLDDIRGRQERLPLTYACAGRTGIPWSARMRVAHALAPGYERQRLAVPYPLGGVPWHRRPGFKLVAVKDVRRLTGLELSELLSRQNLQRLTRIDESGAREEFVRVPVELLIEDTTST